MATDKRVFTLRTQPETYEKIRVIAKAEQRSIAMQIEYIMKLYISEFEKCNGVIELSNQDELTE